MRATPLIKTTVDIPITKRVSTLNTNRFTSSPFALYASASGITPVTTELNWLPATTPDQPTVFIDKCGRKACYFDGAKWYCVPFPLVSAAFMRRIAKRYTTIDTVALLIFCSPTRILRVGSPRLSSIMGRGLYMNARPVYDMLRDFKWSLNAVANETVEQSPVVLSCADWMPATYGLRSSEQETGVPVVYRSAPLLDIDDAPIEIRSLIKEAI